MAKLVIKLNEEGRKRKDEYDGLYVPTWRDLETSIDGREIDLMTELKLKLIPDGFAEATVSFYPDDIDIETDALIALQAVYEQKQKEAKG
ncbi:hypothetical protein AB1K91_05270 [Terribacillus sp. 179-K 1B1 HS]|jgi:hypothetical protein|uniref:hypothetical protein n=1 Tax=Terribacillus sp. 179-K 1B1 HS TaxID=3142388 RepID=UPI0039A2E8F2